MKDQFLEKIKKDPFRIRFTSTHFKLRKFELIPHGNQKTDLRVVKLEGFQMKSECDLSSCYATCDKFTFPKCFTLR